MIKRWQLKRNVVKLPTPSQTATSTPTDDIPPWLTAHPLTSNRTQNPLCLDQPLLATEPAHYFGYYYSFAEAKSSL